ncbi:MAG: ferritin-like domain-containing protein [Candidatus Binatia bacterium]
MRLLKRWIAAPTARRHDLLRDLAGDYTAEIALAQQLREHAKQAPYPAAGERLNEIAAAEEEHAKRLAAAIESLGGSIPEVTRSPRGGRSHWARIMEDLRDEQSAGARYLEQAIEWETEFPEVGSLLRTLEREEHRHRVMLRDLVAKSDPQAID